MPSKTRRLLVTCHAVGLISIDNAMSCGKKAEPERRLSKSCLSETVELIDFFHRKLPERVTLTMSEISLRW
jgi:hypothetical protein